MSLEYWLNDGGNKKNQPQLLKQKYFLQQSESVLILRVLWKFQQFPRGGIATFSKTGEENQGNDNSGVTTI